MPTIDNVTGLAASLPGQVAKLKRDLKDLAGATTTQPNTLTVGAGGLTVVGASTFTGGIAGAVTATGSLSGTTISASSTITSSSTITGNTISSNNDVNASGNVNASGTVNAGSTSNLAGQITSAGTRNSISSGNTLYISAAGVIGLPVSSERYKTDIADAVIDVNNVLALTPIEYRTHLEIEEEGTEAPLHLGLRAEQVEALGLHYLVRYENDIVESVNYELLAMHLLPLVQSLAARITALEKK